MLVRLIAALLLATIGLVQPVSANQSGVLGHWLTENGKAIIEILPCGESLCGRIAWLDAPTDAAGRTKRDANNPDPSARSRPLCGLPLIAGLMVEGGRRAAGGEIYNARNGKTYGVEVTLAAPDRLEVRGYYGISLLGRTQSWSRQSHNRGGCTLRFETAGPVQ